MNSVDRLPLELIRRDQTRVHELVQDLDRRIDLLCRRMDVPCAVGPPPLPEPKPKPSPPPPRVAAVPLPVEKTAVPEAVPLLVKPVVDEAVAGDAAEGLELRVGTYWMARIGIVILLTGLVFLGNYAYHRFIPLLGAWGKLSILGMSGALLGGFGMWLEQSRASMRNYGRVLLAGGAATIYYTAYAAHYVQSLKVIESPVVGGALLLALAGGFMWWADRKRSEALAVPAVLLAYYTSSINPIGTFTLYSNGLLTAAAVFFLIRRGWTRLSFVSLTATYGSYAFWRFTHLLQSGASVGDWGGGVIFVGCYWLLFTLGMFLAAEGTMRSAQRVAFLTLNNGALLAFASLHFASVRPGGFWVFLEIYGAVLLGLAAVSAWRRPQERAVDAAYLVQGLALVTFGLVTKLTGPQLAIVLALESTILLSAASWRHGLVYQSAAMLCAIASCGLLLVQLHAAVAASLALGLSIVGLLLINAWLVKRLRREADRFSESSFSFVLVAIVALAALIFHKTPPPWEPTMFAITAAFSLLALRIRLPEVALPGQGLLILGAGVFLVRDFGIIPVPWWNPLPVILVAIALMHWWQHQRTMAPAADARFAVELVCAAIAVATGGLWMSCFLRGDEWLFATSAAAFGTLLYALVTRSWALLVVGQAFSVLAVVSFVTGLVGGHPYWAAALSPILVLGLTSQLAKRVASMGSSVFTRACEAEAIAKVYSLLASVMLAAWGLEYVTSPWRVAWFAGLGCIAMFMGAVTHRRERFGVGAAYAAAALFLFWVQPGAVTAWIHLVAILAIPVSLRLGARIAGEIPCPWQVRNALVLGAMGSLWWWITRWTILSAGSGQLTTAWAVLALLIFAAGLALRERLYRLGGFAVLALAIGRLFIIDVWRFDTLPRIVSFLALGIVLLALSFVYNRFAEGMRRWL